MDGRLYYERGLPKINPGKINCMNKNTSLTGVEPVTFGFGDRRSIQLSYKEVYCYFMLRRLRSSTCSYCSRNTTPLTRLHLRRLRLLGLPIVLAGRALSYKELFMIFISQIFCFFFCIPIYILQACLYQTLAKTQELL